MEIQIQFKQIAVTMQGGKVQLYGLAEGGAYAIDGVVYKYDEPNRKWRMLSTEVAEQE